MKALVRNFYWALLLFPLFRALADPTAYTVGFSQPSFQIAPGTAFQTNILISPVPANGLFSYGIYIEVKDGNGQYVGVANITPQTQLNYFGVSGVGASGQVLTGLPKVKGTMNFDDPAKGEFTQSAFATLSIAGLPAGTYHLRVQPWNTLGPTEQIFVDGLSQSLDNFILFGVADLTVGGVAIGQITSIGSITADRQTGLLLQKIDITNTGTVTGNFRITIGNIHSPVTVWNAQGTVNGLPYFDIASIAAGQKVTATIEYFASDRKTIPSPQFTVSTIPAVTQTSSDPTTIISPRLVSTANGMLVEFSTQSGKTYTIQYTDDLKGWHDVLPTIAGTGGRIQWIDNGPPKTPTPVSQAPHRFYRVGVN